MEQREKHVLTHYCLNFLMTAGSSIASFRPFLVTYQRPLRSRTSVVHAVHCPVILDTYRF